MEITLLIHPLPYDYESLANYIIRLSEENFCNISWLNKLFSISSTSNNSNKYNVNITSESIKLISKTTSLSFNCINAMNINYFNVWNPEKHSFISRNTKIPLYKEDNLQYFCPICLKEKYYERIFWRLKHIKICLKHSTLLINRCSACNKEITFSMFKSRVCECGTSLEDMNLTLINNRMVISNQSKIYMLFGITRDSYEYLNLNPLKFDNIEYLTLISYFYEVSERNMIC